MSEDMTHDNVDWVAVLFHAAKQAELLNPIVDLAFAESDGSGKEPNIEEFIKTLILDHAGFSRIRETYNNHPYVSANRSLGQVVEEMITLWLDENIPF